MSGATLQTPTVTSSAPDPLQWFETVGLAELDAMAALQTRVDRKYLIPAGDLVMLLSGLPTTTRALAIDGRRHANYMSTYFDTPEFHSYLGAARSRPNRSKVRVRTYLDSETHYLEVKTRSRTRRTVKTRQRAGAGDHVGLSPAGRASVTQALDDQLPSRGGRDHAAMVDELEPLLTTHYQRATLLIDGTDTDSDADAEHPAPSPSRATIDTSLAFTTPDGWESSHPDLAIIETKTAGAPSPVDRVLWQFGHRPARVSKFGVGVALLRPDLPANKWNRVLRRHFGSPTSPGTR